MFFKQATTISNTNLLSLHFLLEHQGKFTSWLAGKSQVCVLPLQFLLISFISFDFFQFLLISSLGKTNMLLAC